MYKYKYRFVFSSIFLFLVALSMPMLHCRSKGHWPMAGAKQTGGALKYIPDHTNGIVMASVAHVVDAADARLDVVVEGMMVVVV